MQTIGFRSRSVRKWLSDGETGTVDTMRIEAGTHAAPMTPPVAFHENGHVWVAGRIDVTGIEIVLLGLVPPLRGLAELLKAVGRSSDIDRQIGPSWFQSLIAAHRSA